MIYRSRWRVDTINKYPPVLVYIGSYFGDPAGVHMVEKLKIGIKLILHSQGCPTSASSRLQVTPKTIGARDFSRKRSERHLCAPGWMCSGLQMLRAAVRNGISEKPC